MNKMPEIDYEMKQWFSELNEEEEEEDEEEESAKIIHCDVHFSMVHHHFT